MLLLLFWCQITSFLFLILRQTSSHFKSLIFLFFLSLRSFFVCLNFPFLFYSPTFSTVSFSSLPSVSPFFLFPFFPLPLSPPSLPLPLPHPPRPNHAGPLHWSTCSPGLLPPWLTQLINRLVVRPVSPFHFVLSVYWVLPLCLVSPVSLVPVVCVVPSVCFVFSVS